MLIIVGRIYIISLVKELKKPSPLDYDMPRG